MSITGAWYAEECSFPWMRTSALFFKKEISPEQQLILDILDEFNVNLGVKSKYIDVIPFFEILSRTISEFEPTPLYNCTSCDVKIN